MNLSPATDLIFLCFLVVFLLKTQVILGHKSITDVILAQNDTILSPSATIIRPSPTFVISGEQPGHGNSTSNTKHSEPSHHTNNTTRSQHIPRLPLNRNYLSHPSMRVPTNAIRSRFANMRDFIGTVPSMTSFHRSFPDTCDFGTRLHERRGSINSPGYPYHWENKTSCTWYIVGQHKDVVTISFEDLDLNNPDINECLESEDNTSSMTTISSSSDELPTVLGKTSCCTENWIKIQSRSKTGRRKQMGLDEHDNDEGVIYCGKPNSKLLTKVFVSSGNEVVIHFHASNSSSTDRGFHLSYFLSPVKSPACKSGEFHCSNGKCIPNDWKCNHRDECGDGSDENRCDDICSSPIDVKCDASASASVFSQFPSLENKFMSVVSPGCYSFPTERCDNIWNCDNGADERGCGGCPSDMFMCPLGRDCYSESKRCDGTLDCRDFSDELNCGFCGPNRTLCDPAHSLTQCYDPFNERCDHRIDCPNGNDEKGCLRGCEDKILCVSGTGCYSQEERCNGIPDCSDYSDEKNCSLDLCRQDHGSYLCANRRCIRSSWVCDRSNDCGDATDEINCLKNSVITAAIMGSLVCGLLLVIAISCTCKLIALRSAESTFASHMNDRHESSSCSRSGGRSSSSFDSEQPLFRIEPDYLYREPPPSYAAAVGAVSMGPIDPYDQRAIRRQQRRLRRHHRRRCPSPPPSAQEGNLILDHGAATLPSSNTLNNAVSLPASALNHTSQNGHNLNEILLNGHQLVVSQSHRNFHPANNLNISSVVESAECQQRQEDLETTLDEDADDGKPILKEYSSSVSSGHKSNNTGQTGNLSPTSTPPDSPVHGHSSQRHATGEQAQSAPASGSNLSTVNIELDSMSNNPSPSQLYCDEEPLLSS